MKVSGIFTFSDGRKVVDGHSKWEDNISHQIGDILTDGSKQWKVVAVDRIHQGCFGFAPEHRMHALMLEPIDHQEYPQVGDELNKAA